MSKLSNKARAIIEELFVDNGYVLNFSNSTFQTFIMSSVGIDIYEDQNYKEYCSKANKLRQIIQNETESIVVRLINDLIEYFEDFKLKTNSGLSQYENKKIIDLKSELAKLPIDNLISLETSLEEKIRFISTRNAEFVEMPVDEKLKELSNLIENLLKVNGKFVDLDFDEISIGFINASIVKDFRKSLQCFRHSSEESILERKKFTIKQKKFLIDFGITISKLIYDLKSSGD